MDGNQTFATVGATASTVLGANAHRRKLTISPPSAGRVTIVFNSAAVLDQGETIQVGTSPRTFTREDVGDLLRGTVSMIADAAGRTVGINEYFVAQR